LQRRYVCTTRMDVFRFTEHFTCHDDVQINKCVHTTMLDVHLQEWESNS
jgi:hypothetical protein